MYVEEAEAVAGASASASEIPRSVIEKKNKNILVLLVEIPSPIAKKNKNPKAYLQESKANMQKKKDLITSSSQRKQHFSGIK